MPHHKKKKKKKIGAAVLAALVLVGVIAYPADALEISVRISFRMICRFRLVRLG